MRRSYCRRAPPRKKLEFSKVILLMVMLTYFVGVTIGAMVVLESPMELTALLTFIGAPTATAIGFYAWKAKAENVHKIDNHTEQEEDTYD